MKTDSKTNQSSHDTPPPAQLISFMLKDWKKPNPRGRPVKNLAEIQKRRTKLSSFFKGEVLVIEAGSQKIRSNNQFYPFRPHSDFFYLTGSSEPDSILVLKPAGNEHVPILFAESKIGKSDPSFFTDRVKGELWEGPLLGVEGCRKSFQIADCRSIEDWPSFRSELENQKAVRVRHHSLDADLARTLSEMRLIKDSSELRELQSVVDSTHRGFEDVISRMKNAKSERELEGVFYTRARVEGNDTGYGTIAASGEHACTLHWKKNDGKIHKGDLLLLDAGVEGNSYYTADITRTLPISGTFSKEQKAIYNLVWNAQQAALKEVRPGNDFMAPNRAAMKVLAHGLEQLGVLPSAEDALLEENQFYKRYTLHNVSHMLGLDVHDCAKARAEAYKYGKLEPGMVLTVEPGLYFQPDDLTVEKKYRGIGVRIEDNVVVTAKGHLNLSRKIPSRSEDVERWIKMIWKKRVRKD